MFKATLDVFMLKLTPHFEKMERGQEMALEVIEREAQTTFTAHPGLVDRIKSWFFVQRGIRASFRRGGLYLYTAEEQANYKPKDDLRILRRSAGRAHARVGVVPFSELTEKQRERQEHLCHLTSSVHSAAVSASKLAAQPLLKTSNVKKLGE